MLHWALSSNRNLDSQIYHTVIVGGKVMKNTNSPFSYGNESEVNNDQTRKFYQFYVGIDISLAP
jgi:hypothetical protein